LLKHLCELGVLCGSSRFRGAAAVLIAALAAGCTAGRDYSRPPITLPEAYRAPAAAAAAASIADQPWWNLFEDEQLQALIRTALEQNFDLRIAATRILEAQAQLGVIRADQFPSAAAGASVVDQKSPAAAVGFPTRSVEAFAVQGSAAWQLDFWGRYRRATEAARAQLLATEWGRRAVVATLVSEVGDAYFGLRALDLQLDIAVRTLESRRESLRLTEIRERGGATSLLDVRQAEQLVYSAAGQIANLERLIEQQENFIRGLLGELPAPVARGRALTEQPHAADVPAGLPSQLLERRPDIQRAEQELVAANAQIGVAKAAFFPQISLTGSGGFESVALTALFAGSNAFWSVALGAVQPVFTAGRLRSQVEIAEARRQEAELTYGQTVQQAFREVSDALTGYRKRREFREQQELLLTSAQDARRLADIRYQGGATSYLEVLDADTRLFVAELGLADAQLDELTELVEIYRALGGGWQP
jgi:multidrug efflux system outer membrane protein